MPYVDKESRERLDAGGALLTVGDLNYVLSKALDAYVREQGGLSYTLANEILGVLTALEHEQVMRAVVPMHLAGPLTYNPIGKAWREGISRDGNVEFNVLAACGVLRAVGFEFTRRFLAPYEDEKIQDNGEVFTHLSEGRHTSEEFRKLTRGM